jgi:hypothetical protein
MRTLSFNTAAVSALNVGNKIRVKNVDGVLFFRPTDRASGVNLPKGERLVEVSSSATGAKITIDGLDLPAAASFGLQKAKYGWYAAAGDAKRGEASVKLAA